MFDQSYQQLYVEKQVISLNESYPCPRCKHGHLDPFGETDTFKCGQCSRRFVAINAGRILYPAERLKIKIAPVFWWDGFHWHLAGTTASIAQTAFVLTMFIIPILVVNAFAFFFNHGHLAPSGHLTKDSVFINMALLNVLTTLFMSQLFYLFCWDQNWVYSFGKKKQARH